MKSSLLTFTISFLIPAACVYFFAFTSLDKIENLSAELNYYKQNPDSGGKTEIVTTKQEEIIPDKENPQEGTKEEEVFDKRDTVFVQLPAPEPVYIDRVVYDTTGFAALEQFRNKYSRIVGSYNKARNSIATRDTSR